MNDRAFFEAALDDLEAYLLSDELYWPLSMRGISLPRLTLGGLLLTWRRLQAYGESRPDDEQRLSYWRERWRAAWEKKARREFASRFNLWRNYLEDYFDAPSRYAPDYPQEVRQRVLLELLRSEIPEPRPEDEMLSGLDARLRTAFLPGNFLWEAPLQPFFPPERWWYLYGRLKT